MILKNNLLLIAIIGLFITNPAIAKAKKYTPTNTSISFDMDKVLLKVNVGDALWRHKGTMATSIFKPVFWKAIKHAGSGEQWVQFFEDNKAHDLAAMVREINNNKTLITGTEKIIEELAAMKYTLFYATNMGQKEYARHKNNFKVLDHFKDGVAVPYHTKKNIVRKPDANYYELLLNKIDENLQENAIFIDDKIENVIAARHAGMIGIHFKNPEQLRAELVTLKILKH